MSLSGTLTEAWLEFKQATVPGEIGPHALLLLQCAFFAGAMAQTSLESQIVEAVTEKEAMTYLASLEAEVQRFFQEHFTKAWAALAERRRQQGGAVH